MKAIHITPGGGGDERVAVARAPVGVPLTLAAASVSVNSLASNKWLQLLGVLVSIVLIAAVASYVLPFDERGSGSGSSPAALGRLIEMRSSSLPAVQAALVPPPPLPGALPRSVPRACSASFNFWRPHVLRSLQWWPAGSISKALLHGEKAFVPDISVQIIDGALFYAKDPRGWLYDGRPGAIVQALVEAMSSFPGANGSGAEADAPPPPNVDFFVSAADHPVGYWLKGHESDQTPRGLVPPVLSMCRKAGVSAIAVPDFSFVYWGAAGAGAEKKMRYHELIASILAASARFPYRERIRKAVFHGKIDNVDRVACANMLRANVDLIDAGLHEGAGDNMSSVLALAELPRYRVQLYIAGNGYSASLKYKLATGSPVIMYKTTDRGEMDEFFTAGLVPYVHYVPAYHPDMIVTLTAYLLANPLLAEAIGSAGRDFVRTHLMPANISCWWRTFLEEYAHRQAEEVIVRAPESVRVPLGSSSTFKDVADQFIRVKDGRTLPADDLIH